MNAHAKQFIALPFVVIGVFITSAMAGVYGASKFTPWTEPFVGPTSAAAVIAVTFWFAPAKKPLCGMITLLIGAGLAWLLLRNSDYPESHPRAYQPTLIPFWATIAGGVGSYILCWFIWRDRANRPKPEP